MKINNIVLLVSIVSFYYLFNQFVDMGGLNHYLLKILLEFIFVLFIMILLKYENEIKEITDFDVYQKKILDYFKKNGK